jgi:hypothetical protein
VLVGQDLRLDVAAVLDVGLDEALAPAEGGAGLAHGHLEQRGHLAGLAGDAQPAAAAAVGGLDRDRQSVLGGEPLRFGRVRHRAGRAGHQRRADPGGDGPGRDLVTEGADGPRRRPDPGQPRVQDGLGEAGVLGQEAVAGVDGLRAGLLGRRQQPGRVEISVRGDRPVQRQGLVGQPGERGALIRVGVDRDGRQAGVAAGPHHPQRDLAAVGNEDALELLGHGGPGAGWPWSGWPWSGWPWSGWQCIIAARTAMQTVSSRWL